MDLLTADQIQQRINAFGAIQRDVNGSVNRYVRPLTEHANNLIDSLAVKDGIGLGLAEIDVLTRGFRPTDLVIITGFAHSGKTQLVNTMIYGAPRKRVLFFSLDDPAEMILAKLVAMQTGTNAEILERRVVDGDEETKQIIRECASDTYQNLIVVDDQIGITGMHAAVAEATELWGHPPDAVIIDYLEMMPGTETADGNEHSAVKHKANALKSWANQAPYPLIVLHQGTRSNARPGEPITLLSLGYGGEQQGTIIIGCRRQRDKREMEAWDRQNHQDTITVHVVKNKRPGGRCTHYEGVDFYMEADTGLIRTLDSGERSRLSEPDSAASRAARALVPPTFAPKVAAPEPRALDGIAWNAAA